MVGDWMAGRLCDGQVGCVAYVDNCNASLICDKQASLLYVVLRLNCGVGGVGARTRTRKTNPKTNPKGSTRKPFKEKKTVPLHDLIPVPNHSGSISRPEVGASVPGQETPN